MNSYDAMRQYRELLAQYQAAPRGQAHYDLSEALRVAEENVIKYPPPGKSKGLIHGGVTLDCPTVTEAFDRLIPISEWIQKITEPDAVRLRPYSWASLDQNGFGACAGDGVTGTVLTLRDKQNHGKYRHKLNGFFPYHWSSGGVDRGSTLSDNLLLLQTRGVCTEEAWPRSNGPFRSPPESAMENALRHRILKFARVTNKLEYGNALLLGFPVYSGYSGHAWYACELIDTDRFRWKNSWGKWGDEGFGTLSFSSVEWSYGCYAILSVTAPDDEV